MTKIIHPVAGALALTRSRWPPPSRLRSRDATMKNWVAVASAEHVQLGQKAGFMQICHGKSAPLRRIRSGDVVAYYSPTYTFRGPDKLRAFTAIGIAQTGEPYPADMGGGFRPYRRNVNWLPAEEVPIQPLLDQLSFTTDRKRWGYQLRFGLFEICAADMEIIAKAMRATLPNLEHDYPQDPGEVL